VAAISSGLAIDASLCWLLSKKKQEVWWPCNCVTYDAIQLRVWDENVGFVPAAVSYTWWHRQRSGLPCVVCPQLRCSALGLAMELETKPLESSSHRKATKMHVYQGGQGLPFEKRVAMATVLHLVLSMCHDSLVVSKPSRLRRRRSYHPADAIEWVVNQLTKLFAYLEFAPLLLELDRSVGCRSTDWLLS
jgi:hypothetical protein